MKQEMLAFWEATPCGTRALPFQEGSREYFLQLEKEREEREPFIAEFATFDRWRAKKVLEVGIGAATDLIRFARGGALLTGVDITEHSVRLARQRLAQEVMVADVMRADAEELPFKSDTFDFVYSWGVIHHTRSPEKSAKEILRVTRPGGRLCVMIYHRYSLVALQAWLLHALLPGRPWRSLTDVIWHHIESLGTKAYSRREAHDMFTGVVNLSVTPVITPYDARIGRARFLSSGLRRFFPPELGWFLVVTGEKAA